MKSNIINVICVVSVCIGNCMSVSASNQWERVGNLDENGQQRTTSTPDQEFDEYAYGVKVLELRKIYITGNRKATKRCSRAQKKKADHSTIV